MNTDEVTRFSMDQWKTLGRGLKRRIASPFQYPTFILYFFALMLGVGLVGTWSAVWEAVATGKLISDIPFSLATYSIAVVASAFAEVVIEEHSHNNREHESRISTSDSAFRMFSLLIVIASVALGLISLRVGINHWTGTTCSVLAAALSLFLWWIVNAENPNFQVSKEDPQRPLGGLVDPDEELPGSLDGLKS